MSATGRTTNYQLPTYIGTDKTTWLTDFNGAMTKIDTEIKTVETSVTTATSVSGQAMQKVDTLTPLVSTNAANIVIATSKANQALTGLADIFNIVYPVGCVYTSKVNTSPAILFTGTWEVIGAGKVLVGVDSTQSEFSTVGRVGGTKTETLTVDQIPAHSHYAPAGDLLAHETAQFAKGYSNAADLPTGKTGGGQAHNNLMPYETIYRWCRTL